VVKSRRTRQCFFVGFDTRSGTLLRLYTIELVRGPGPLPETDCRKPSTVLVPGRDFLSKAHRAVPVGPSGGVYQMDAQVEL
jgi:hypothetical protein